MSYFLQGMALGFFMVSPVMLMLGVYNPRWVLPKHKHPSRFRVIGTYAFVLPVISFFLGVSTFWGGFGPTLPGWLAGILAPSLIKLLLDAVHDQEKKGRQLKQHKTQEQEQGTRELKAEQLTAQDDPLLHRLAALKARLQGYPGLLDKPLYLQQPDRFYSRYLQLSSLLAKRFQPDELTAMRLKKLALHSLHYAVDRFTAMEPLLSSLQGLDQDYLKRRLQDARHQGEKQALEDRQQLIARLNSRMLELMADNEMALTALDTTLTALASINTEQRGATQAAREALNELKRFSEQLNDYDHSMTS